MRTFRLLLLPVATALAIAVGCSGGSGDSGLPAPSIALTAGDGQVRVDWLPVAGATQYGVYWASDPTLTSDNYGNLPNSGRDYSNASPDLITGLANGTTYWFVVVTIDAKGAKGPDSNRVAIQPTPWVNPSQIEGAPIFGLTDDALTPAIVASPGGLFHAVWSRELTVGSTATGRYAIHGSDFDGSSWSAPLGIDSADGYSYTPQIAADGRGGVVAVWRQGNGTNDHIWANAKTGPAWKLPVQVDNQPGSARNPVVAGSPGGAYVSLWSQLSGTNNQVFAASLTSAGTGWSAPVVIDNIATADADLPRAGMDAAGHVLAVWQQNGGIYAASLVGAAWSTPISLSTGMSAATPSLAVNGAGHALALWVQQPGAAPITYVAGSWYNGSAWGPVANVSSGGTASTSPFASIDASDRAGAVWLQSVDGTHQSVLARDYTPASGWRGASVLLADFTGNAKAPLLGMSAGELYALWPQQVLDPGGGGTFQNIFSSHLGVGTTNWDPAFVVSPYGQNDSPALAVSSGEQVAVWTLLSSNGELIRSNHLP